MYTLTQESIPVWGMALILSHLTLLMLGVLLGSNNKSKKEEPVLASDSDVNINAMQLMISSIKGKGNIDDLQFERSITSNQRR